MFVKLMRHICSIDVKSKDLIVDVMAAISKTEPCADDDDGCPVAYDDDLPVAGTPCPDNVVLPQSLRTPAERQPGSVVVPDIAGNKTFYYVFLMVPL